MSVTYHVSGSLTFVPPLPLAALWESLESRLPFRVAPSELSAAGLADLVKSQERLLIPAPGAVSDMQGRPSHIAAAHIDYDDRIHVISGILQGLSRAALASGHDFDWELEWFGEDGNDGCFGFFRDGGIGWWEDYHPDPAHELDVFGYNIESARLPQYEGVTAPSPAEPR